MMPPDITNLKASAEPLAHSSAGHKLFLILSPRNRFTEE
jgi:hypothetical protein